MRYLERYSQQQAASSGRISVLKVDAAGVPHAEVRGGVGGRGGRCRGGVDAAGVRQAEVRGGVGGEGGGGGGDGRSRRATGRGEQGQGPVLGLQGGGRRAHAGQQLSSCPLFQPFCMPHAQLSPLLTPQSRCPTARQVVTSAAPSSKLFCMSCAHCIRCRPLRSLLQQLTTPIPSRIPRYPLWRNQMSDCKAGRHQCGPLPKAVAHARCPC